MDALPRPEDLLYDDPDLLADRLLRSLHRDKNGHLAAAYNRHPHSVSERHNCAILYCYLVQEEAYTLIQHYVHSPAALTYKEWLALVTAEGIQLHKHSSREFYGVYGWLTVTIAVTPLRTGDVFIKIDAEGARGVRLAFNSRTARNEARKKKK